MNITERTQPFNTSRLEHVNAGQPVKFLEKFHPAMNTHEPFMVCSVTHCYMPDSAQYQCKKAVVNLRTGRLSYVDGSREVVMYRGDVTLSPRS